MLANPTNMQARHAVRSSIVAHGVIFGVMCLMIGMIHVAPLGATPETPATKAITQGKGFARFHAYPWATIVVDGKEVGTTPMETVANGTRRMRPRRSGASTQPRARSSAS